uniref:Reverse transcriptase domain-containing protein n=1 Tax=Homalodisca liturata TaxID=320908 RepID=A0A1B6H7R3_9HEMI
MNTQSALTEFTNSILHGLDGSRNTAGIFCDLSKAFDCVDHSVLLLKLHDYGIGGNCLSLLKSYLTKRKQRTVIQENYNKVYSNWKSNSVGVPQGSILGPLFFLIFINDLPRSITKDLILFADDTTAIIKSSTSEELIITLSEVMDDLDSWFHSNGLKLNIDKTQVIKFGIRNNKNGNFNFPNLVDSHKFLGIKIDSNFKWKAHLNDLLSKLRSISFIFLHLRENVSFDVLKSVYHGYVESILSYGIVLWGLAPGIKTVFRLQKRIIRIMTNSHFRAPCKSLFRNKKILTLTSLYIYELLVYIHLSKDQLIEDLRFQHNYNTRNNANFRIPLHRSTFYEKSPLYSGLILYNNLPLTFKSMTIGKFKNELKTVLIDKAIYEIDELQLNLLS